MFTFAIMRYWEYFYSLRLITKTTNRLQSIFRNKNCGGKKRLPPLGVGVDGDGIFMTWESG